MKKMILFMLLGSISTAFAQNWQPLSSYPCVGGGDGGVTFTIGNKIYTGGGFISKCFYEYDPQANQWTQKADLPVNKGKAYGIAFTINGKGYVGLGFDMNGSVVDCKDDLWEYDSATDKWEKKSNYPGKGCDALFSFVVNGKAYVGGGELPITGPSFTDMYSYDPLNDTWTKVADYPDTPGVTSPFAFSANGLGYVSCGTVGNMETSSTYQYDPSTDKWIRKADYGGSPRQGGTVFVDDNKVYCGWGDDYVTHKKDFYAYDIMTDTWQYAFDGPGDARTYATAAVVNNKTYIGLGWSATVDNYYDWHMFSNPNSLSNVVPNRKLKVHPNPSTGKIYLDDLNGARYSITDVTGKELMSSVIDNYSVDIKELPQGVYILSVNNRDGKLYSTFITRL